MNFRLAAPIVAYAALTLSLVAAEAPPKAGKVEIMKESEVKAGMQATAWTVFAGTKAEAVPVEIVGILKNMWGPRQDVILGKMGGKAARTNVAGGMSGSPVYINGKLIGAVSTRLSVFSPDAICGITPIELMLEINDLDQSRPQDARTPQNTGKVAQAALPGGQQAMVPIETPLTFSGFNDNVLRDFSPMFQQMGVAVAQGGTGSTITGSNSTGSKPVAGWDKALNPGEAVAGVLVSGDMNVTGLGTVTYNDGKRVLAFGHSFFNLGPVEMPMSKGEVVMVLSSAFQPNKLANATEIVGALRQDRHSGIMGVLGQQAPSIPVNVKVRSGSTAKDYHFNVFVQQKWTPYLMMMTLYNAISGGNESMDEVTYRLSGQVQLAGKKQISLSNMQASGEMPMPAPMALAGWWGEKFNKLYLNAVNMPDVKSVNVTVDLLPERRIASIENAWVEKPEARAGEEVPVKVFLRPYRGPRIERTFTVKIPAGWAKGEHRILLSDADTLNRMQAMVGQASRYIDVPETISLINQERSNNKLYVSLLQSSPTAYFDDKTLPSLPSSVLNVMQAGRAPGRPLLTSSESATEQTAIPFDYVVSGSYSLKVTVN